ncbi:MFS transporter, OFA family, oxalate/formate antiporter [Candidatus Hakubella thermalkaliphila]|uniref:MFS transporter, OFA family, oxalate/formate antiporter n=1 Tax=Candidatus Hakubella thermalkaliphila TaxID=2754717 RepID=A0A6V8PKG3_9ACTN|nr:MFS transporter, OFA family, oxalate/formate antiporter [Candidatus Hakubella thermalkaliphila]
MSNSQNFASPPRWLGVDLVKNRWIFPFLGLFTTLMGGAAYAFSVFILPLEAEFGWVRADTVLAFSVCMFVFGILMAVGGYFVDKYGPKKPFVLGAALMIASQVLSSQITTLTGLVLTYGVVLGIGIGLTYTSATIALTSRWYPEREKRSLMIGVAVVGFGLGAVVAAPLWAAGIAAYGWRTTYMLTGGVFAVVLGVIATIIQFPPINYQFSADKGWHRRITFFMRCGHFCVWRYTSCEREIVGMRQRCPLSGRQYGLIWVTLPTVLPQLRKS